MYVPVCQQNPCSCILKHLKEIITLDTNTSDEHNSEISLQRWSKSSDQSRHRRECKSECVFQRRGTYYANTPKSEWAHHFVNVWHFEVLIK